MTFFLFLGSGFLFSMENKPEADNIKLLCTEDNKIVLLPREIAQLSSMLQQDMKSKKFKGEIVLPKIKSRGMKAVKAVLLELDQNRKISNERAVAFGCKSLMPPLKELMLIDNPFEVMSLINYVPLIETIAKDQDLVTDFVKAAKYLKLNFLTKILTYIKYPSIWVF